jgi:hypothetical protein
MKKSCLSNLQYLLLALVVMAMTGCGANHSGSAANAVANGGVSAKLVWAQGASKATAKSVAAVAVPSSVASVQFTVTGTGPSGALPVVRSTVTTTGGTVSGIYPGTVTVAAKALDVNGNVVFEGFALRAVINAGATTTLANPIIMTVPVEKAQDKTCIQCHETTLDATGQNLVAEFKQSGHYTNSTWNSNPANGITGTGCAGCHGPSHNVADPSASGRCAECHTPTVTDTHHATKYLAGGVTTTCSNCHNSHNPLGPFVGGSCVACHAFPQDKTAHGDYVNDNNGVRAITTEFSKWSHHVTGVALNDAHCAACHLEGKVANGKIIVDTTKHMADAKTHLRNVDSDADFAWDPSAPDHSGMDNFCMSCHDANGAASAMSAQIQNFINTNGLAAAGKTASASNPFGDTISNRYDKMQRPGVIDASSQFNTGNNSHHGVKGPRYSGRTRFAGARQIGNAAAFALNSSQTLQGVRSTIFDAGNLNQLYTPLANAAGETFPRTGSATLGDDSTLHCGDCHTVGQWKVASSETANGNPTPVAIGAHGSNNEYMLRNSIGTDQRHTQNAFLQGNITGTVLDPATGLPIPNGTIVYTNPGAPFLVCYNCHTYNKYGSIYLGTGLNGANAAGQPHAGEYDAQGRCNGIGNTIPFNGYTTGTATDGTQFASRFMGPVTKYSSTVGAPVGEQNPDFGNIFGIQCLNCHNSGIGNAYGGIHGSAKNTAWNNGSSTIQPDPSVLGGAYIDGMGNTTKVERFLPGLGDAMHVPGTQGGFTGGVVVSTFVGGPAYTYVTGGISNDTNWEQKHWQQLPTTVINATTGVVSGQASSGAGCYTLGATQVTGAAIVTSDVTSGLVGPSVTGENGAATEATDTWGGCDDHTAGQGKGNHGFLKRIVRPVTY